MHRVASVVCRKHEECVSNVEKKKEEFSKYEQQDVAIREELKHIKATSKKLEKSLDQEKKKVHFSELPGSCSPFHVFRVSGQGKGCLRIFTLVEVFGQSFLSHCLVRVRWYPHCK